MPAKTDRREFLKTIGRGATAAAAVEAATVPEAALANPIPVAPDTRGAAWIDRLLAEYRVDLFDDFLPFMDRHVVDERYGGFLCYTDRNGKIVSSDKNSVFEGRGIWLYSYLYNHVERNERYLETARRSAKLLLRTRPRRADEGWPRRLSQRGEALGPPGTRVANELYIAEGLQALSQATAEQEYLDLALELVRNCVLRYDRADYEPTEGRLFLGDAAPLLPGGRPLSHWTLFLRVAGQLHDLQPEGWLSALKERSIDTILERHVNPRFALLNELLRHDLSRPGDPYDQLVSTGNAIGAGWTLLYEARRNGAAPLFDAALEHCRRHIEVAWDPVYGGVYRTLRHVDENRWDLDKVAWVQEEALLALLAIVESRDCAWAREWFDRLYAYVRQKFSSKGRGLPLWLTETDRTATSVTDPNRVEHYHHPRHLLFNLESLQRMRANQRTAR